MNVANLFSAEVYIPQPLLTTDQVTLIVINNSVVNNGFKFKLSIFLRLN